MQDLVDYENKGEKEFDVIVSLKIRGKDASYKRNMLISKYDRRRDLVLVWNKNGNVKFIGKRCIKRRIK